MHLKTLTLKGFKSFASATTLRLEPGVTCVVGPNGSGKSNVVDAITWVLGEQGAKALRGGKMEDVIFAGTAERPPLGRAEVTLTIDNTDGVLPIDYTEVSITRRMFRSGESEYAINGSSCRLLDVTELLSDSGIGREMHVVVGQGQLESVLQARPEDRRGFIEEAAGVLKHRKRKERALRKLDGMRANLTRLTDLITELGRQLKPLGRQAEVASRAATIQAELRDARLRLLADDVVTTSTRLRWEIADDTVIREQRDAIEQVLAAARASETETEALLARDAPALAAARETSYALAALTERFHGTAELAAERRRNSAERAEQLALGRDPDDLAAEAADVRRAEAELGSELQLAREHLAEAESGRGGAEAALNDADGALAAAARSAADRRERLATLAGRVDTLRSTVAAGLDEVERLSAAAADADARAGQARAEFDVLQAQAGQLDDGELGLDSRHEEALRDHDDAVRHLAALQAAEHETERQRSAARARSEALALGLRRRDGSGALLAADGVLPGVLGPLAELLSVRTGFETAVAAALGPLADAVAVRAGSDAAAAIGYLKDHDAGRATAVPAQKPAPGSREARPPELTGLRWAADMVTVTGGLGPAVGRALAQVVIVDDLAAGQTLVAAHPQLRAVTVDGDVVSADHLTGGSASAPSVLEMQAAFEEAGQRAEGAQARLATLASQRSAASAAERETAAEVEKALDRLHESDARMAAFAEQLGVLNSTARSAAGETQRLRAAQHTAESAGHSAAAALAEAERELASATPPGVTEQHRPVDRAALAAAVAVARAQEVDARLAVRTGEERARALAGRADDLSRQATAARDELARQAAQRRARAHAAAVAGQVLAGTGLVLARLADSLAAATADRDAAAAVGATRESQLADIRTRIREHAAELDRLTGAVHRDEVARTEQRLRIDALHSRAAEEFGIGADELAREYGPDQPVPPSGAEIAEYELAKGRGEQVTAPLPGGYQRAAVESRAAKAERELKLLGKVNPLALEEFAALSERHAFLAEQLEDLRSTRRDLQRVVTEVDERIQDVFTAAYADTAREFAQVFAVLFPGGEGRLVLTDPADMLTTGVEVEARPPGKKVKRLSLLSGGERSLVAAALLVAIFRARPSPFYVLDEIEAALDDTNLGRLLGLLDELRSSSQLIVITHQKRTMEIADALYGVSMRGDGITTVISQRLRELTPA